jgi:NhaA family Na+:H+ antiporter
MATDIAFALGVLAVFGTRAPIGLKVFLTALAIADDLGAVLVIAVLYTEKIRLGALLVAGVLLVVLFVLVRAGFKRLGILLTLVLAIWLAVFTSGVHATVAGILVAMVIPVRPRVRLEDFVRASREQADRIESMEVSDDSILHDQNQLDAVECMHSMAANSLPSGLAMERHLHPIQVWFVLPLFALANAGVHFDKGTLGAISNPIALGIILGLVVGKPLGIGLFSWVVIRAGRGALPEGVTWGQLIGDGCLAGIGFTMSLFVTELAFAAPLLVVESKVGILVASLISGHPGRLPHLGHCRFYLAESSVTAAGCRWSLTLQELQMFAESAGCGPSRDRSEMSAGSVHWCCGTKTTESPAGCKPDRYLRGSCPRLRILRPQQRR